jgi:hypothetical protein
MDADPLLAVGSVAAAGSRAGYAWHCYLAEEAGGLAPNISQAEARLIRAITLRTLQPQARRAGFGDLSEQRSERMR